MSEKVPHGETEINAYYGNPRGHNGNPSPTWEETNIVDFTPPYQFYWVDEHGHVTPVTRFKVHRKIVDDLNHILIDVYNSARKIVKEKEPDQTTAYYDRRTLEVLHNHGCDIYSGAFNFRFKRGQEDEGVLSGHSWGAAIDFDAEHNAFGSAHGTLPTWFIRAFTDRGWGWGGAWSGKKDWMHFQKFTGY